MGISSMRGLNLGGSIVASVVSVTLLTVGCTTPPESSQIADTISRPASALNQPPSTPDAVQPPHTQDGQPRPTSLVIDVGPFAEIGGVVRAVFQDSGGTLWIGGECDLFRNDGSTLTSYDIKDDLGRGQRDQQGRQRG